MYPNENLDLANPGLSPSDRATLSQIDNQPRSDGEAEKILFSLAPQLDPLATRFLRDIKHKTFAYVTDGEIATWLQQEWNRTPDDSEHAKKEQRLNALWRAAADVEICAHPESRGLLGRLGIPASLAEAKRRYREVAGGGN